MEEEIYERFGFDFSQYNQLPAPIEGELTLEKIDKRWNHTSYFFRNAPVFRALQARLFPLWRDAPQIKIWCAGCARGEEAYSLAILLHEAGLLSKTQILATDISPLSLEKAQTEGYLSTYALPQIERDYAAAGGKRAFADYTQAQGVHFFMKDFAKEHIHFQAHDLLSASPSQAVDLILCRNVLIYFQPLAYRNILQSLYESLSPAGFLCLGAVETVLLHEPSLWESFDRASNLYRKRAL